MRSANHVCGKASRAPRFSMQHPAASLRCGPHSDHMHCRRVGLCRGTPAGLSSSNAHIEIHARCYPSDVQACAETLLLAAGVPSQTVRELPLSEEAALLIAHAQHHLLALIASCWLVRTSEMRAELQALGTANVEAVAHHGCSHGTLLVGEAAGVASAARPTAGPNRILALSQERALLITKASVHLLIVGARAIFRSVAPCSRRQCRRLVAGGG